MTKDDLKLRTWQSLEGVLPKLRECMGYFDGASFLAENWDCKYIDARIDMRTGAVYLKPGNEPPQPSEAPHCSTCSCGAHEPEARLSSLKEGDMVTTVSPAEEPSVTLNGYQIKEALEFVAPDGDADQLETDVTIQWGEGHCGPGHYASLTEYPDEGSILLAGDPPESPLNRKGD